MRSCVSAYLHDLLSNLYASASYIQKRQDRGLRDRRDADYGEDRLGGLFGDRGILLLRNYRQRCFSR